MATRELALPLALGLSPTRYMRTGVHFCYLGFLYLTAAPVKTKKEPQEWGTGGRRPVWASAKWGAKGRSWDWEQRLFQIKMASGALSSFHLPTQGIFRVTAYFFPCLL